MTKILITGAAGYIGSIMVPRLLEAGYSVLAVDNFMYRQASLLDCCSNLNFELIRGDCRNQELIGECLKKVDAIFPLACLTGAPSCKSDPVGATTTIRDAVGDILEMRSKDQQIIYPTTNSGYGIGEKDKYCTEETPLRPISLYGRLKADTERALLDAGNVITLRLATVFGASPRMRTDLLVNDFVLRAVRDRFIVLFEANFKRNYLHIRNVADAFIHCLENFDAMKNEPYNVGLSEANISKRELCEEIQRQIPEFYFTEYELGNDPDKRDYIVSNEKIEAAGFKAKRSLQEGISELIKAYHVLPASPHGNV
ncbi:MAG: NAD(P)-dependent oxidoreductase [Phycisphaerae bacterium]|nr:NAD(P)-dependent oxidoreductase [Phycisphaerae bacterium]